MSITTDIVIIGAGSVGLFAIFQAGMLSMSCHVIEAQGEIGGQCQQLYAAKPIYDIPGYPMITAMNLIEQLKKQAKPFKPVYHCGRLAASVQKRSDNKFQVTMDNGQTIVCTAVIVAGGCGAFEPNRPDVVNLDKFTDIYYAISNPQDFAGKSVAIAGGGDSAADWAIILADIAEKVYFVHRREKLRCHASSEKQLKQLAQEGKIEMVIPYQLYSVDGWEGELRSLTVRTPSGDNIRELKIDALLIFFGLQMYLGPIADWGLELHNKKVVVNQVNCASNIEGIYAVGDIASYPGKLKLILTGFSEVASACYDIQKLVFPDEVLKFEYSTNKDLPQS